MQLYIYRYILNETVILARGYCSVVEHSIADRENVDFDSSVIGHPHRLVLLLGWFTNDEQINLIIKFLTIFFYIFSFTLRMDWSK